MSASVATDRLSLQQKNITDIFKELLDTTYQTETRAKGNRDRQRFSSKDGKQL